MHVTLTEGLTVIESGPDYVRPMTWDWWKDNLISLFRRAQAKGEQLSFDGVALYVKQAGSIEQERVNVRVTPNGEERMVYVSFRKGTSSYIYRLGGDPLGEPLMFEFPLFEERTR